MLWFDLPPAGNAIAWRADSRPLPQFAGYRSLWVSSGTAALALALLCARRQWPEIGHPEVILPAYGCPDLVAAAVYAGVKPVLVDISSNDPGYDLEALSSALCTNTIAVVAVNFLGVRERLEAIRKLIAPFQHIALVEDDAQWFPEPLPAPHLRGDFVCISFGRGKPVSLLGGGLLLMKETAAAPADLPVQAALESGAGYVAKLLAYNALLQPWAYGLISRNPLLKLGQTVFKPLSSIRALDQPRLALLASNIERYGLRERAIERGVRAIVAENASLSDFTVSAGERCGRLLRYPVLCRDQAQRDRLLYALQRRGLGATAMYQRILPEIDGVAALVKVAGSTNAAAQFARRLLTLPLHEGVRDRHLRELRLVLRAS